MRPVNLWGYEVKAVRRAGQLVIKRPVRPQPWPNRPEGILRLAHIEGDFCWPNPALPSVRRISNSVSKPGGPDDWVRDHSPWAEGELHWVREGHAIWKRPEVREGDQVFPAERGVYYLADLGAIPQVFKWKTPQQMPRWASRMTVRVAGVRLHRLHEIDEEEAKLTGVEAGSKESQESINSTRYSVFGDQIYDNGYWPERSYLEGLELTWEELYPKFKWHKNPWVWSLNISLVQWSTSPLMEGSGESTKSFLNRAALAKRPSIDDWLADHGQDFN